jgi:hypothetical protein
MEPLRYCGMQNRKCETSGGSVIPVTGNGKGGHSRLGTVDLFSFSRNEVALLKGRQFDALVMFSFTCSGTDMFTRWTRFMHQPSELSGTSAVLGIYTLLK